MKINKEQFLALSLSMSLGLSVSCQKKDPKSASDSAQTPTATQDPTEEAVVPTDESAAPYNQYGSCDEAISASGDVQYFSYDSSNECYVECTDESTQCYDIKDECVEWDNTNECIDFVQETTAKAFPNGCTKLFKENESFTDPTFECYEW